MRKMLVTDLERAIIERLREEHISIKNMVIMSLDLPYTKEGVRYQLSCYKDRGLTPDKIQEFKLKQALLLQRYQAEGYGSALEIGQENSGRTLQFAPMDRTE
jgi:hypothetical protein